jgi:hypothetical protein
MLPIVVGVAYRKAKGLPMFQPPFPDVELRENWISGASSLGLLGGLAKVNNALWYVLTREALNTGAHFPFNLVMIRFVADFDLRIPIASILTVEETSSFWRGFYVRVTYSAPDKTKRAGGTAYVDLTSRRGDELSRALREKVRAARGAPHV